MVQKFKNLLKIKRKLAFLALIFVIALLFLISIRKSNKYEIITPFFDTVIQGVYATGYVKTNNYADITPNIVGRIEEILF